MMPDPTEVRAALEAWEEARRAQLLAVEEHRAVAAANVEAARRELAAHDVERKAWEAFISTAGRTGCCHG